MTRRFRQDPATISRRLTDGVVVLPLDGEDDPLFLPGTGGDLWDALATPHTLDELAAALAERYAQPPARIAADIRGVLDDLVAAAVVTVDDIDEADEADDTDDTHAIGSARAADAGATTAPDPAER